jgi:hypothetical protein
LVVPAVRPLVAGDRLPSKRVSLAAAVCFGLAFVTQDRGAIALLTLPWLAVVGVGLLRALRTLLGAPPSVERVAYVALHAFLVVAAVFAFASRAGWSIVGIDEPIVELTGVHFHYAGYATLALALRVARAERVPHVPATLMRVLGMIGPAFVASGFTFSLAFFQIMGAVVMTAFAWSVAGLTLARIVPRVNGVSRALLLVSSLAVVAPMVLAIFWAVAQYYDVAALAIPDMARVHGTLNGIGFVGCGVAGWRVRDRQTALRSSITRRQRSTSIL